MKAFFSKWYWLFWLGFQGFDKNRARIGIYVLLKFYAAFNALFARYQKEIVFFIAIEKRKGTSLIPWKFWTARLTKKTLSPPHFVENLMKAQFHAFFRVFRSWRRCQNQQIFALQLQMLFKWYSRSLRMHAHCILMLIEYS